MNNHYNDPFALSPVQHRGNDDRVDDLNSSIALLFALAENHPIRHQKPLLRRLADGLQAWQHQGGDLADHLGFAPSVGERHVSTLENLRIRDSLLVAFADAVGNDQKAIRLLRNDDDVMCLDNPRAFRLWAGLALGHIRHRWLLSIGQNAVHRARKRRDISPGVLELLVKTGI
ncbi:hypothetical protein [Bordetella petrii]|uniref:hypothetical protein n=1 Tax=Bordetella petrii TaxID=94624 RepID=UPI001A95B8D4|nr:hypothetical protein [Bordetella petrii]MBO1110680.1 hypothetical protein [Bordetella petrii]